MRANMGELLRERMQDATDEAREGEPGASERGRRRRTVVVVASLGIHAALVWLALSIPSSGKEKQPRSVSVSVVDLDVAELPAREPRQLLASAERPGAPGTPVVGRRDQAAGLSGRRGHTAAPLVSAPPTNDPFAELSIKYDGLSRDEARPGAGTGEEGTGPGAGLSGVGRGLGIAAPLGPGGGGSLRVPPPPPSQARPPRAKYDYHRWAFRSPQELGGREVSLELDIDARGEVTAVRVLSGVDRRVDQRAAEYARTFEFYPALDDAGQPIASVHRWIFVLEGVTDFRAGLGNGKLRETRAGVRRTPP